MTRPHAFPLLLAAAALTAGCGGPDRPLGVSFKEVPSNVVLGAQSEPTPEPAPGPTGPPQVGLPPPPSVITLPPPQFEVPVPGRPVPVPAPEPTGPACPVADPLQVPKVEAPSTITARPAAAQYLFRNVGSFEVSGADARSGDFPENSLRTVSAATEAGDDTGFEFSVTELLGTVTTTTTYQVVASQPLPTGLEPGLYLREVKSRGSDGQESVFRPVTGLPLGTFPLTRGSTVEARGVDPTTGTAMTFTSTVTGKARVDACGEQLDSWVLDVTDGRLISPSQDLEFTATYSVGTQYGGLLLREVVAFVGEDSGAGVSRTNTSTISQVPTAAPGPQP